MKSLAITVLILVGAIGCRTISGHRIVTLADDSTIAQREVLGEIPLGTPVSRAKAIMESKGFTCSKDTVEKDFLFCYAEQKENLTYSKIWKVFIYYENDCVTDVSVTTGFVGL